MALAPLATATDLSARGIDVSDSARTAALLEAASAAVREAAGSPIVGESATISVAGNAGQWLTIPVSPVRSVTAVAIDETTVGDWRLIEGRLWRLLGWQSRLLLDGQSVAAPSIVTVTLTYGLDAVPADIVDLVCSLVAGGVARAAQSYDPNRSLAYERIDDYQRGFRQGDDEIVSPLELPERTRAWLRQRFGGGAYVTGSVR